MEFVCEQPSLLGGPSEKIYQCEFCNYELKTKMFSDEGNIICPKCKKTKKKKRGNKMIENINVELLLPHPDNPRKDLGDLTEMTASIKENGIFQNLTAVENTHGTYTVIIGHRRLEAAKLAGLTEVPVAIVEMDDKTQLSTMLLENMQRSDLTMYEQAQGIQLCMNIGMTEQEISTKTGFSRSTVRRRKEMLKLDQEKVEVAVNATLEDYILLEEVEDIEERNRLVDFIGTNNFNMEVEKAKLKQEIAKELVVEESIKKETVEDNKVKLEKVENKEDEIIKISRNLRINFMKNIFKNKLSGKEIGESAGVIAAFAIEGQIKLDNIALNEVINQNNITQKDLIEHMLNHKSNYFVATAYAALENDEIKDNLYDFLEVLGYEISDDERNMLENAKN